MKIKICENDVEDIIVIIVLVQIVLWIWFLGCIRTYRIGKYLLVEGMGIKSAEFVMLCLYSIGLISFHFLQPAGKWILFAILMFWLVVQFFCHWYYTIFGVSEKKLKGYNDCFRNTIHIFPISEKRLVPDLYHMILHILILGNTVLCII